MAFDLKSLPELNRRAQAELPLSGASPQLRRNLFAPLARALAGSQHGLQHFGVWIYKQLFPATCDDDVLEQVHAPMRLSEGRKAAAAASGYVLLTGNAGATIDAGTVFNRTDGVTYTAPVGGIVATDGTCAVRVVCDVAGLSGNMESGGALTLSNPIAGVDGEVQVIAPGLSGGADMESIDELRQRVKIAWAQPGEIGIDLDYEQWAKEVPGITRAWAVPKSLGPGTISVYIMRDNDPTPYPDASEVAAVAAHLDQTANPFGEIYVFAPVKKVQNYSIRLKPNTPAVQAAVTTALKAFHAEKAAPVAKDAYGRTANPPTGISIPNSQIREAISAAQGEFSHELISPSSDIVCAIGEMSELGGITWL